MLYGFTGGESPKRYAYAPKIDQPRVSSSTFGNYANIASKGAETSFSVDYWPTASNSSSLDTPFLEQNASSKDHTGIEQASQAFRDKVADRLANGIGAHIIESDKTVLLDLKMLLAQKMSMASNLGFQKNVSGQVKMLLSAFSDVEWFVGTILSNFNGVELPAPAKEIIATLRAMQRSIMAQIKSATGLNLSDEELRALLEQDPAKAGQNINLNWLVQQDQELTPKQNLPQTQDTAKPNQADNLNTNGLNTEETINGIQSNPRKYQTRLKSATTKIVKELQKIMQQVQSLMGGNHKNPQANTANILALLDRGAAICMVAMACDDLQSGSEQSSSQLKGAFENLNQNAIASIQMASPQVNPPKIQSIA